MEIRDRLYVDGAWAAPEGSGSIEVLNPATEEVAGRVPAGTPGDVDRAVRAARTALPDWSGTPLAERVRLVRRVAEGLQERAEEVALLVTSEVGTPLSLSRVMQAAVPPLLLGVMADTASSFPFEEPTGDSLLVREPVGVVGAITPWNFPLQDIAIKVGTALLAGCTVVLKPSELAPLNAFLLAEVAEAAGLPPGALNLVTGTGDEVGEAIAAHPDVDMVSFTGSTRAGRRVAQLAAATVKRVTLELGGKSPGLVLDDADLETAVTDVVGKCFVNTGQSCTALARLLVPRGRLAEAEAIAARLAGGYVLGDPVSENTTLGPVISAGQRDRVLAHVQGALEQGARLVAGGPDRPDGLARGFFVRPTVLSDVHTDMTVAQEEVFGPVLAILPWDSETEAVTVANDTVYGLTAAVWSGDRKRALGVARRLRCGQVEINGGSLDLEAPFCGRKQSGYGRQMGRFGLEEFLDVKSVQVSQWS